MQRLRRTLVFFFITSAMACAQSMGGSGSNGATPAGTTATDPNSTHLIDTVEEQALRQLPINRRDLIQFTLLAPGVADSHTLVGTGSADFQVPSTPQSGLSFNGSNGRGNSATVSGAEANDDMGGIRLTLGQEAVQDFNVYRNNYSADMGWASGGAMNIVSKSGTNNIHGSAFGFFRNQAMDARDPFAFGAAQQTGLAAGQLFDPTKPDAQAAPVKTNLSRQQFGGSIGLPVVKDKTFVFGSYEAMRGTGQDAVPTLTDTSLFRPTAGQTTILNGLAAMGGTPVPCLTGQPALPAATCATILQNVLTVNPATSPLNKFLVNEFQQNSGLFPYTAATDFASGRMDHKITNKNLLNLLFSFGRDNEQNQDLGAFTTFSRGNRVKDMNTSLQGAWLYQLNSKLANEARLQWSYSKLQLTPNDLGGPGFDVLGYADFGRGLYSPSSTLMQHYQFLDNVTVVHGNHTMRMGGSILIRGNRNDSMAFLSGRFSFSSLPSGILSPCLQVPAACGLAATVTPAQLSAMQNFSLGLPQFYEQGFSNNPSLAYSTTMFGGFWQDSWKARPNLTLDFGVRYDVDGRHTPLNTDKKNFAPRFAFAWDPMKDDKTVVRGGFGMFYAPINSQINYLASALANINNTRQISVIQVPLTGAPGNPALTSAAIFQTLFAQGVIGCTSTGAACITPANMTQFGYAITGTGALPLSSVLFGADPNMKNPYSEQAEFGVQRELAAGVSVSADLVHVHTLRLPNSVDTNLLPAPSIPTGPSATPIANWNGTCGTPAGPCFVNPNLEQNNVVMATGSAHYDAGILQVKKRFSDHFSLLANYTYSKAIDNVTDYNSDLAAFNQTSLAGERSLADYDQRHKLVMAAVLQSPWQGGSGSSLTQRIFSGFSLSPIVRGNSGHPFNLLAGTDVNGDRNPLTDRPAGAPRNSGLGPNFWTVDMRLGRGFDFGEKGKLQFMIEGFNLMNRANYTGVNNFVGDIAGPFNLHANSGLLPSQPLAYTSANPRREVQFGLRFDF